MKIDAYILCFNEELMIRHTLNHYSTFCNKITILDNYSSDKTLTIIKNEYPKVTVVQFDTENKCREDIQTELKNNCWKQNKTADYVIICDMDELLFDEDMKNKLYQLKQFKPAICSVTGYDMFSEKFPKNYNAQITSQVKNGIKNNDHDKTIIFNPKKVKEINYDYGAHNCKPEFYKSRNKDQLIEFKLLHYKYIGKNEIAKKHALYKTRLSKINILNSWGIHYLSSRISLNKKFNEAENHCFKIIP